MPKDVGVPMITGIPSYDVLLNAKKPAQKPMFVKVDDRLPHVQNNLSTVIKRIKLFYKYMHKPDYSDEEVRYLLDMILLDLYPIHKELGEASYAVKHAMANYRYHKERSEYLKEEYDE